MGNFNWCGGRFSRADLLSNRDLNRYTRLNPARGDFGLVAVHNGLPVAVGWAIFFPESNAGYGFIDPSTPEINLWVREGSRGHGVGRMLLLALIEEARNRGIAQVSLSVEAGNFARDLYLSEGFVPVAGREADGVMSHWLFSYRALKEQ